MFFSCSFFITFRHYVPFFIIFLFFFFILLLSFLAENKKLSAAMKEADGLREQVEKLTARVTELEVQVSK